MADLPRIFARPDLPSGPGLPRYTPDSFGAGAWASMGHAAGVLAETFGRIDEASVEAESRRVIQETQAKIEDAIKQGDAGQVDPDLYHRDTTKAVKTIYDTTLGGLKNPKVIQKYQDSLSPFLIKSQTAIDLDAVKKKVLVTRGNGEKFYEDIQRELNDEQDPVKRAQIEKKITDFTDNMVKTQAYSPIEGAQRVQRILEQDHALRATIALENSTDPVKALAEIRKQFRQVAPERAIGMMHKAQELQRQAIADAERREKQQREDFLRTDLIDVTNGRLSQADVEVRALKRKYTPDQIGTLYRAFEQGGVTSPDIETQLEVRIRSGQLRDYSVVAGNRQLDRGAKSRLMGLMDESQDAKHFSKKPEYQEATKEIRSAIAPSGPLETFTKEENERLNGAQRELWDRVQNGENPVAVSRNIQDRISRQPKSGGSKPAFLPRFQTPQAAAEAYRTKKITRQEFDDEALRFRQWEEYQKNQLEIQQRAPQASGARR